MTKSRGIGRGHKPEERRAVSDWLKSYLSNGDRLATDVESDARALGYSIGTLRRVKKELGIKSKHGVMPGIWYWSLPTVAPVEPWVDLAAPSPETAGSSEPEAEENQFAGVPQDHRFLYHTAVEMRDKDNADFDEVVAELEDLCRKQEKLRGMRPASPAEVRAIAASIVPPKQQQASESIMASLKQFVAEQKAAGVPLEVIYADVKPAAVENNIPDHVVRQAIGLPPVNGFVEF